MSKPKFERTKPHMNVGTIGHVDHGKTTLTAAITKVLAKVGKATEKAYADIAKGGTVRDESKILTIAVSHVESCHGLRPWSWRHSALRRDGGWRRPVRRDVGVQWHHVDPGSSGQRTGRP